MGVGYLGAHAVQKQFRKDGSVVFGHLKIDTCTLSLFPIWKIGDEMILPVPIGGQFGPVPI